MVLLKHDLNIPTPSTVPPAIRDIIDDANLPDLTYVKIPLLRKKKAEKETILLDSWVCASDEVEVQRAIPELKSKILIPAFQNAIEGVHFEQIHWNTRIRKVAGMITELLTGFFDIAFYNSFLSIFHCIAIGQTLKQHWEF